MVINANEKMCHEYKVFCLPYQVTILLYQLQKEKEPLEAKLKGAHDQLQREKETLEAEKKKWDEVLKEKDVELKNTIQKIQHDGQQEITQLINTYAVKVEERDKMIDRMRRTKLEVGYYKDGHDDAICDYILKLVEHYSSNTGSILSVHSDNTALAKLECSIKELNDQNNVCFTQQSPTASLMISNSAAFCDAFWLKENESAVVKNEVARLKEDLETYTVQLRRQSQAIFELKKKQEVVEVYLINYANQYIVMKLCYIR